MITDSEWRHALTQDRAESVRQPSVQNPFLPASVPERSMGETEASETLSQERNAMDANDELFLDQEQNATRAQAISTVADSMPERGLVVVDSS